MNIKVTLFAISSATLMSSCGFFAETECTPVSQTEWQADERRAVDFTSGYGAKHDTYISFSAKSDQYNQFTCEVERIYCPAPHDTKGCQRFQCTADEVAGAILQVKDYKGERFYKVPKAGPVKWNGDTYTCPKE